MISAWGFGEAEKAPQVTGVDIVTRAGGPHRGSLCFHRSTRNSGIKTYRTLTSTAELSATGI